MSNKIIERKKIIIEIETGNINMEFGRMSSYKLLQKENSGAFP